MCLLFFSVWFGASFAIALFSYAIGGSFSRSRLTAISTGTRRKVVGGTLVVGGELAFFFELKGVTFFAVGVSF